MAVIIHIDMDYFFAQVEERENPHFKGKPVVVGSDPKEGKGRGVVSTCNYEARKYGVKSGMPISKSYQLVPHAIFLPVNMNFYKKVSASVFKIIEGYTKKMEKVSLDEAYIDVTKEAGSFKKAKEKALKIKEEIFKKESLTCTAGVGENKMMAKIACEIGKPNGLKVILPSETKKILSSMDVAVIPGIGPKTKEKIKNYLKEKEVRIKDAKRIKKSELENLFGKRGKDFFYKFRGRDDSPVVENRKTKSVGREHTFAEDTKDAEKIMKTYKKLIASTLLSVRRKKLKIKGVVVTCRFEDFDTHTKQVSFKVGDYSEEDLYKKSLPLLLSFLTKNKKIRLIGFRSLVVES